MSRLKSEAKHIAFQVIKKFTGGGDPNGFALKYFTHRMVMAAITDHTKDVKVMRESFSQIRRAFIKLGYTVNPNRS